MSKNKTNKEKSISKQNGLEALIDAQLDGIVVGGFSRTVFSRVRPN